jgi:hypothetical protein
MAHLFEVDDFSAAYSRSRANATNKTPTQIISELVREKMVVAI